MDFTLKRYRVFLDALIAQGHAFQTFAGFLEYAAIRRFEKNLATLREIAPVKTICMEGAPLSKYDNRDLWGAADHADRA